jgi:hypothetical protein
MLPRSHGGIKFIVSRNLLHLHKFLTCVMSPPSLIGIISVAFSKTMVKSRSNGFHERTNSEPAIFLKGLLDWVFNL